MRADIPFDTFSNRERKEKEGCSLVLIPGRLLHIHKFCTECQPPVVMLRPRVSRAFALSALITARFVPLSTARPRLETKLFRNVGRR